MQNNNMREVWEGMKTITGCSSKRGAPIEGDVGRANQLNQFFNRFDHPNPFTPLITAAPTLLLPQAVTSKEEDTSPPPPLTPSMTITAAQVCGELRRLRPSKAAGPDGVSPRLLKACARELGHPLQRIFNLSLGQGRVPSCGRHPASFQSPRNHILTHHALDPLQQFAYREKTGVEDAIIFLLHRSLSLTWTEEVVL
ncbi:hypothetical protein L3Q82_008781 [Scortum barcoo]|uniref:Uncharacterized protein n=1 Tax=Scortum barcoo TaxID=214431 RepID=A0ACB8XBC1_9TELE|nr:hypothetical protein L3Q82_008781 [Scortum barcoo]